MFTRLHVKDYQSIKKADLDLAPFTVIVGSNRSGKSALLRALHAAIFNDTGETQIRKGQKQASVEIETEEGDWVIWTKTKTSAEYELNGQRFTKLAGGVPDAIADTLGVREIAVDSTFSLTPQIHEQGEYAFLLDKSQGQAAKALAKMTRLDVVIKAQLACRAVIRDIKADIKAKKKQLEEDFLALDEWDTDENERDIQRNTRLQGKVEDVGEAIQLAHQQSEELVRLEDAASQIRPSVDVPLSDYEFDQLAECAHAVHTLELPIPPKAPRIMTTVLGEKLDALEYAIGDTNQYEKDKQAVIHFDDALGVYESHHQEVEERLAEFKGLECPVCGGIL